MFASKETLVVRLFVCKHTFVVLLLPAAVEEKLRPGVTGSIVTVDDVQVAQFSFVHVVITETNSLLAFVRAIAAFPVDIVITVITFIAGDPLGLIIAATRPPIVPGNTFRVIPTGTIFYEGF